MRVLVVSSTFPQYPGDPRGRIFLRFWERAMAQEGAAVRVLAPRTAWCEGRLPTALEVVRFAYAPQRWSMLTGRHGILENVRENPLRAVLLPGFLASLRQALRRELEAYRPDRVAAHMLLPGGYVVAAQCAARQVPFELFGHGSDVDLLLGLPEWLRTKLVKPMRTAQRIAMPSFEKVGRFRRAFGSPLPPVEVEDLVEFVCEGRDALRPVLAGAREETAWLPVGLPTRDPRVPRVLYMGRLTRQKGVDDLLVACARLHRGRSKAVQLDIAGDGPERSRLERLAERLGIGASFHGFVEGEARAGLFAAAHVVCVPSRELARGWSEGAPLVVPEALAYGAEVVTTDVGGLPELARRDARIIMVPAGDGEALTLGLARALAAAGVDRGARESAAAVD